MSEGNHEPPKLQSCSASVEHLFRILAFEIGYSRTIVCVQAHNCLGIGLRWKEAFLSLLRLVFPLTSLIVNPCKAQQNGYGYSCNHVTAEKQARLEKSIISLTYRYLQEDKQSLHMEKGYMVTAVTVTIDSQGQSRLCQSMRRTSAGNKELPWSSSGSTLVNSLMTTF